MKTFLVITGLALASLTASRADEAAVIAAGNMNGKFKSSVVAMADAGDTVYYLLNREGQSADYLLVSQAGDGEPKILWGDSVAFVPEAGTALKKVLPGAAYQTLLKAWAERTVKQEGAENVRAAVEASQAAIAAGKPDEASYTGDTLKVLMALTGG